jgi:dTDP-4-amino-4,6-dideoxygalactose transaminase
MTQSTIPFVDLKAMHDEVRAEIDLAIKNVIDTSSYILGPEVEAFEKDFAAYCGTKHAIGLDSGLSALELSLAAAGVGEGDEVISVSHTFIATVSAIALVRATPVLVDVDPRTCLIDISKIEKAITPKTKAILPVHLYGQPADMDAILDIAKRKGLIVIEDAAQAHGAYYKGKRAGSLGLAGCFSFYPAKNLGALGDGGIVTTNDDRLAEKLRTLRNYGQTQKYHHAELAYNRRLDTLHAAVLRVKLRRLDAWNAMRQSAARAYAEALAGIADVAVPEALADRTHVYHLYVIQHPRRDALADHLKAHGIATGLHYPIPVHQQECFKGGKVRCMDLTQTERLTPRILSLPMYPHLSAAQARTVASAIRAF